MHPALPFTTAPQSVCILRLSAIGDCTHVVPLVRCLQRHWPDTRITWIIGKLEYQLFGDLPGVEFIVFDKSQGRKAYCQLRRDLQGRRFDILLNLQIALRASLASLLIKAPIKLGYDKARAKDKQWLFTNARIPATPRQHVLDGFFEFARAIGLDDKQLEWNIPIPADARAAIDQQLDPEQPVLVINPCSSNRARNWRNWSAENYAAVAEHAVRQHGMQVVLTGGPAALELEMGQAIAAACAEPLVNLIGKTRLKELLALLDRAALMLSPDTGPAHMATTVGTPVIGLYATSNPERTGPYLSLAHTINAYPDALREECGLSVAQAHWGQRVRSPDAMLRIGVADVIAQLDKLRAAQSQ